MAVAQRVSESTDLVVFEKLTPVQVFAPGGVNDILDKITREVRSTQTDISTKAGREAVASLAYKVARSKTALDEMGKTLVADWKTKSAAVDAERRTIREKLDDLRDEVRKPLTDWENAEKDRIADHEAALAAMEGNLTFDTAEPSSAAIRERLDASEHPPVRHWEEFAKRAAEIRDRVRAGLIAMLATAEKREANKKHLAKINNEVLAAFVGKGVDEEVGKVLIVAIARGEIPHTKIAY